MQEEKKTTSEEEEKYEMTPEEAVNLGGGSPGVFNRKKTLIVICAGIAFFVMLAVVINYAKTSGKSNSGSADEYAASRSNSSFLNSLRDSALRDAGRANSEVVQTSPENGSENELPEPLLPQVSFSRQNEEPARPSAPAPPQPQNQSSQSQYSGQGQGGDYYRSSLVPQVQGSLFSRNASSQNGQNNAGAGAAPSPYDDYLNSLNSRLSSYGTQQEANAQQNSAAGNSSDVYSGRFLGENSLWTGTVIFGILETAVNTDLPGSVLARVTQNVYDSQTGRVLLIQQGTLLLARYNNSVSYAQSRVQIIWDALIRPDGFQIDLEGANSVDRAGMSGQAAKYDGNFFEYLKAAGIITLFSIANGKLTETVNSFPESETTASNVAQANFQFFNRLAEDLVSRAGNIQPTLTVENGTLINIMLNKTLYLPPAPNFSTTQKYILE